MAVRPPSGPSALGASRQLQLHAPPLSWTSCSSTPTSRLVGSQLVEMILLGLTTLRL